ncbi:hypothetical protein HYPSUDRAFT_130531 [Hypholoma sublateritium FD-334 SS-4]|uniref:Mmc1 C-terminal domain-containing protein n=1 Tax=Hypholoma sublateritium (strain FD-334 SS-4) TaxID=945553 RepID=A0A0D2MV59_HYPSF|nr:hypothetical protein HYPSUDRAFT_130531 [Hypholoma sublateritium FD-334 SS-4]
MLSCPPIIITQLSTLKTYQRLVRALPSRSYGVKLFPRSAKGYATSSPVANGETLRESNNLPKPEALTLLHKAAMVVPRVLEASSNSPGFLRNGETSRTWESILSDAHEDLSTASERPARIVVYGLDEWSGSAELVTALLSDPLADAEQSKAFETRWKEQNGTNLNITDATNPNPEPASSVRISSGYLNQFPIPVEITEFRTPAFAEGDSSSVLSKILGTPSTWMADVAIIVCNPLTTSLPSILDAHLPANAIIVLSANIAPADLNATVHSQAPRLSRNQISGTNLPDIISVDPRRALDAIRTLQAEPGSLPAIQRYQAGYIGSRLADVTQALRSRLAPNPALPTVRTNLALNHISDALRYSVHIIQQLRSETDKAFIDASHLTERIREVETRVANDVFGRRDPGTEKIILNEVEQATKQAEKDMKIVMDRLTWWRMVWRIDEISGIICSALRQSWCYDLEKRLVMQTGQLAALQTDLTKSAFTLLTTHSSLSTAVLRNNLLQLKGSPRYHLTPKSLTQPLVTRRNQIIEYPTARLHAAGQRAVLGMTGGSLSGIGVSWAGWLGWMVGSGEGLLGFVGIDAGTAIGLGLLTAVASIRWAIGSWEKSKKRWWQDWERAAEGLDRDLKVRIRAFWNNLQLIVRRLRSAP